MEPSTDSNRSTLHLAVWALVLAFIMWPAGLILSIIALARSRKRTNEKALAAVGLTVSLIGLLATVALIVLTLKLWGTI